MNNLLKYKKKLFLWKIQFFNNYQGKIVTVISFNQVYNLPIILRRDGVDLKLGQVWDDQKCH